MRGVAAVLVTSALLVSCATNKENVRRADSESRGLAPGQISRVVMKRYKAFRSCYVSSEEAGKRGNVTIVFMIEPEGFVSRMGESLDPPPNALEARPPQRQALADPEVTKCMFRVFLRMKFPEADKPTGASWTFSFRPGGG